MQRLIFGEGLLGVTLQGIKKITLRKYREGSHDFLEGQIIRGEFMDGLNILLEVTSATETKKFSDLTDQEAQEDGFADAEDAFNELKEYYPGLSKEDDLATIRFKILTHDDIPVVSLNEYSQ